jgi:hypothetical protein
MQIQPNSGSWTNSAASQQISTSQSAGTKADRKTASNFADLRLEQSEKSGDRDAQERYQGPQSDGSQKSADNDLSSAEQTESILHLPAFEDTEPSQLDLMG